MAWVAPGPRRSGLGCSSSETYQDSAKVGTSNMSQATQVWRRAKLYLARRMIELVGDDRWATIAQGGTSRQRIQSSPLIRES